jgi:antitoxin (DNA-binding transcriptional repressor) of toxin-antitoxin stability system
MSRELTIAEVEAALSQLIECAYEGEEIVVCKGGEPYARIVPPGRPFGIAKRDLFFMNLDIPEDLFLQPMTPEELAEWEDGPIFPPDLDESGDVAASA